MENNKPNTTTYPTPKGVFTVIAVKNISSMKAEQTGIFEFQQMRFSHNIMVMGSFGDMVQTHPEKHNFEMLHKLYFYKAMTYKECVEAFKFELFSDSDFERLFKDFKPEQVC